MPTVESMTLDAIVAAIAAASYPPDMPVISNDLTTSGTQLAVYVKDASNVVMTLRNSGTAAMAAGVFAFEASLDSTDGSDGTWVSVQAARTNDNTIETGRAASSLAAGAAQAYGWEASVGAFLWFRVRTTTSVTASSIAKWFVARGTYPTEPIPSTAAHGVTSTPIVGTDYALTGAATTNASLVGSGLKQLMEITVFNPTAATIYLKLYNKATAPTVGTDVPRVTIPVPTNGLVSLEFGGVGKRFSLGLGVAITAGPLATDNAAVAVGVQVNATYI